MQVNREEQIALVLISDLSLDAQERIIEIFVEERRERETIQLEFRRVRVGGCDARDLGRQSGVLKFRQGLDEGV